MKSLFLLLVIFINWSYAKDLLIPLKGSLDIPFSNPLHVVDGKILKAREFQSKILLTGLKEGQTTLRAGSHTYTAYVLDPLKIKTYTDLKLLTEGMMGLEVQICELQVCVVGELLTLLDYQLLLEKSVSENLLWTLQTQMSPEIQSSLKNLLKKNIGDLEVSLDTLLVTPRLILKTPPLSPDKQTSLKNRLASYGVLIEVDPENLSTLPMVDLKVEIVEFKKTSFTKLGLEFPGSYKASIVPKQSSQIEPFEIALHNLEQSGEAQVLASPRLSCRSGEEAQFLAGGEFPIRIMNYRTNDIQWKKHGILLKFKPLADKYGKIRLSLTAEVSLLDTSQTVDGVPGLLVNRVESHVDMKSQETLSLSGLIKKIQGQSTQGFRILSQIPILGLLFGSQDYRNDQSDLVIFITPKLL